MCIIFLVGICMIGDLYWNTLHFGGKIMFFYKLSEAKNLCLGKISYRFKNCFVSHHTFVRACW